MKINYYTYKLVDGTKSYFNQYLVRKLANNEKIIKQCWADGVLVGQYLI